MVFRVKNGTRGACGAPSTKKNGGEAMSLIEANRNFLLAPLQVAIGMVEARHVAPILSCALIEIEAGKMAVTATDGVMQTTIEADVPGAKDARVTVLACKLIDILRVIQTDATVALDLQGARLRIVSGDSKFSLQTMPAEDFPKMVTPRKRLQRLG